MEFFNRKKELKLIEEMVRSEHKQLLVMYGRRRLGKTAILRHLSRKHATLYFSCPLSTKNEALRLFQSQLAETFNEPLLRETRFPGWPEAMRYAFAEASKRRIGIIFDEFPYLMRSVVVRSYP
ncbi:MAG: hypothetical protein JRH15_15545 [Deltaproteobacteria bacterium]|nr:hypothetical protein [Deltaproteobacteria bacterium]